MGLLEPEPEVTTKFGGVDIPDCCQ
jgi:hypothetical protein